MENKVKGVMIFYVDVGQLPPVNVEAFIERQKKYNKELCQKLNDDGIESLWMPIRPNSQTRIEFIPISEMTSWKMDKTTLKPEIKD